MPESKTYTGGCHCGKVRYEVTTDMKPVISCNCSICSKKGSLLTFVPQEAFKLVAGNEAELSDYQFNTKTIHHLFCPVCGIASFSWGMRDGKKSYAINVRCLDDIDPDSLELTHFDGKSR